MVCVDEPSKVTVPPLSLKVPPLFDQLPNRFVFVPAVKVPEVRVALPLTVQVAGGVKFPLVSVRSLTVNEVVLPPTLNVVEPLSRWIL